MTPAPPPPAAPPVADPVNRALADPALRGELVAHALAVLGRWLADKPRAVRIEEAEDAVQEACAVAARRRATFDPDAASVAAWVHGILARHLFAHARGVRGRPAQPPADPAAWERLAADLPAAAADARHDAAVLLARLDPDQRALLDMRYRDDLDAAAIAARLGITPGAARVRLCRALAAARAAAGEDRP